MAKPEAPPPSPPELLMPRSEAEASLQARIEKGEELRGRPIQTKDEFDRIEKESDRWSDYNTEMLRRMFSTSELADEYAVEMSSGWYPDKPLSEFIGDFRDGVDVRLNRLTSILERLELIPLAKTITPTARPAGPTVAARSRRVFVVHGHDETSREKVARFLEHLDFVPIILHEQPNAGRTIIEKFEDYSDVGFAVVLLTPDDVGAAKGESDSLHPRVRQNVIFELGFFVGLLGRRNVCALRSGGVELPSDIHGVLYVEIDAAGAWRLFLAKELREAGFEVDMNSAM